MKPEVLASLIGAGGVLLTALLTFGLWWLDSRYRRKKDGAIAAALYINPFIDACEQLQSRLYNVFRLDGLPQLRKHYEKEQPAFEMLFQLARYCGWERIVRRYASQSLDQKTVKLLEEVRKAFSGSQDERWRFYREEQKTLGQAAVRRVPGSEHEFEEVAFKDFVSELTSTSGSLHSMASAWQAIESVRNAGGCAKRIDGRLRLERAQATLVEILERMEAPANYSVFIGRRKTIKGRQCCRLVPRLGIARGGR